MRKKLNSLIFGLIAGLAIPLIIFFAMYYSKFKSLEYIKLPFNMIVGKFLPIIFSWCILPNLLLFFIFNWLNWFKSAKGVLIITMIQTVVLFILKFAFR